MGDRINTAVWIEARSRWQINVQKDGNRKTFTSSKPGRTGQREANKKADDWLSGGVVSSRTTIKALYALFEDEQKDVSGTSERKQIASIGRAWIVPHIGNKKVTVNPAPTCTRGKKHEKMEGRKISREHSRDLRISQNYS